MIFCADNLSPEQMEQIYNYLEQNNIDVIPEVIDETALNDDLLMLDDVERRLYEKRGRGGDRPGCH